MKILFTLILLVAVGVGGYFAGTGLIDLEAVGIPSIKPQVQIPVIEEVAPKLAEAQPVEPPKVYLDPVTMVYKDGTKSMFELAKPFRLTVAAEGLGKARFMTMSPDGRLFIPDMVNMNLSKAGKIYILEDFDPITKSFKTKTVYLSGLFSPNSVAFYNDETGKEWIYIALTDKIIRYAYKPGDKKPSGAAQTVTTFPAKQVPGETSIVWHITRTIKFHDGRLYASVGSGCNGCEQPKGEMRAMIYSMTPTGGDKKIYADGLRNAVGFEWADDELYATVNGFDNLGRHAPAELMYKLSEGLHYGWPYCYQLNGKVYPNTAKKWVRPFSCSKVPVAFAEFEPHAAPLGLEYFDDKSHPLLKNSFLVALHGSFEPELAAGYHIMKVSKDGKQEVFMDGFLSIAEDEHANRFFKTAQAHVDEPDGGEISRPARPVDILQYDANSFLFSDDHKGRVYYVYAE